jgi:hypothetical protein
MHSALLRGDSGIEAKTRARTWLLVRLFMGACLLACLLWLAICFLLTPLVMYMRRPWRRAMINDWRASVVLHREKREAGH